MKETIPVHMAYRAFATTVSQLKICDFSGETFTFSIRATTTKLLSSG
jgi:hypothetical protein